MVGKVLVTGASGFLGGRLTRMLAESGMDVRALIRRGVTNPVLDGLDIEQVDVSITHPSALVDVMEGVSQVYHCESNISVWGQMEPALHQVNVVGTRNLCLTLLESGRPRMVYASSAEAVGSNRDGTPADEQHAWRDERIAPYTASRREAELIVRDYAAAGAEVVIVNPTYMLGPGDHEPSSGRLVLEVATRRATGYPTGGLNVVDVRDVCVGMCQAMELGTSGQRYILGGHNVTYHALFDLIADIAGKRRPRVKVPRPLALAAGAWGDFWGGVTGREPTVSSVLARYVGLEKYYDSSLAQHALDLPQTPLRQTLEDTLEWFRTHHYLDDEQH
ncbi:MAG: NAD-dependent epimerase/dehydratase family protein [Myxococcota bacterium]